MATETLVRVHLGGHLGKQFAPEWSLYLAKPSPAEAVRAIDANTKGALRRFLYGPGAKRHYKVALARKDNLLAKEELVSPSGGCDIYILPTVRGAKSGLGKIIAGVLLIAASFVVPGGPVWAKVGFALMAGGASLTIGGIVQLITPVPNFNQNDGKDDDRGGTVFTGNAATMNQGSAIGLVYGRMRVAAMPVSIAFRAVDRLQPNAFAPQEYTITTDENGLTYYTPITPDPQGTAPVLN